MKLPSRVCLGVIVGAKGLRGEVRIKSFTEDPADIAAYGPVTIDDGRTFIIKVTGTAQGVITARIKGVDDRNAAEALKGRTLSVDRKALPDTQDGSYYHADLVGLAAALASGEALGKVTAVYNFGAGDMFEVTMANGRSELVPFTDAAIAGVDMANRKLTIHPLPGLFENDPAAEGRQREEERAFNARAADEEERRKEEQEGE
jgi:16S rRNA processing protein RimM